ncbi:MAG: efflux RND transporter periplasmic adaptor subunit [Gammaproteobacteria bacterium]|nr:efflux RND transporter periplasmic adaptor subunit [Gammaproteobacteria bacterium]
MIRHLILSLLVLAGVGAAAWQLLHLPAPAPDATDAHGSHGAADAAMPEIPKGPHRGKWFERDGFAVELAIFETRVPPEFHVYLYRDGQPLPPESATVSVKLGRLDGQTDAFAFTPVQDYLRGDGVVVEPHSFDVTIEATHAGQTYQWAFSTYEGRTTISAAMAQEAGIVVETAGERTLIESLRLNGRVMTPPNQLAQVRARFPGVVQQVAVELGDTVKSGDVLAHIQSNDSLQTYPLKAPIGGIVIGRDVQPGAATGDSPLFLIADLSRVWVELDVFGRDVGRVRAGQAVVVETLDGAAIGAVIDWVSPLATHASQSVQARVVLDNAARQLRPGQFVRGAITVAEHPVPLAVRREAIQKFRDFQVVFARIGETYEVRMLELGREDANWVEVSGGLKPGTEYVTENSYLIKADIEKSGASHDH